MCMAVGARRSGCTMSCMPLASWNCCAPEDDTGKALARGAEAPLAGVEKCGQTAQRQSRQQGRPSGPVGSARFIECTDSTNPPMFSFFKKNPPAACREVPGPHTCRAPHAGPASGHGPLPVEPAPLTLLSPSPCLRSNRLPPPASPGPGGAPHRQPAPGGCLRPVASLCQQGRVSCSGAPSPRPTGAAPGTPAGCRATASPAPVPPPIQGPAATCCR